MTFVSLAVLAFWLYAVLTMLRGIRLLHSLEDLPALQGEVPTVSMIVPARNEERHVEQAMRSLLAMDYPSLEIIAVDDRSDDSTGEILDRLAREDSRLTVLHVTRLPDGWLGKLNAMQEGADHATGELLLFADGDVYFHRDVLSRAVRYLQDESLDHLCSMPRLINTHWSLRMVVPMFSLMLYLHSRPWKLRDPDSTAHMGVGAFNLVRRSAFETIGGFERIRLCPDDDMKLGKLVKQHRLRQDLVEAGPLLEVEWYHDAPEMVRGLEKNSFAFLDYSMPKTIGSVAAVTLVCAWPLLGLPLAGAWPLDLLSLLLMATIGFETLRRQELPATAGLLLPLGGLVMAVAMLNSMLRTLARGGILWRGNLYPLEQLRRNRL